MARAPPDTWMDVLLLLPIFAIASGISFGMLVTVSSYARSALLDGGASSGTPLIVIAWSFSFILMR